MTNAHGRDETLAGLGRNNGLVRLIIAWSQVQILLGPRGLSKWGGQRLTVTVRFRTAMKGRVVGGVIAIAPVSRRTPVAARPYPVVAAPSPGPTDPNESGRGAGWRDLDNGRRHGRGHKDRGGSHYWSRRHDNRCWNRNSEVDTEMNPGVHGGDSNSGQSQNCDSLFHNL